MFESIRRHPTTLLLVGTLHVRCLWGDGDLRHSTTSNALALVLSQSSRKTYSPTTTNHPNSQNPFPVQPICDPSTQLLQHLSHSYPSPNPVLYPGSPRKSSRNVGLELFEDVESWFGGRSCQIGRDQLFPCRYGFIIGWVFIYDERVDAV